MSDVKGVTFTLEGVAKVFGFKDWALLRKSRRHQPDTPDAVVLRLLLRESVQRNPLVPGVDFTILFDTPITNDDVPF